MRDETFYRTRLAASAVPEGLHDGLVLYLTYGYRPGSFLTAVLSNDLKEAVARGDVPSQAALADLVRFLYTAAPASAWGSPDHVHAWREGFQPAPVGRRQ